MSWHFEFFSLQKKVQTFDHSDEYFSYVHHYLFFIGLFVSPFLGSVTEWLVGYFEAFPPWSRSVGIKSK